MAIDTIAPRSRRALLAAATGGLAALAVAAFGRPAPARATHSGDVSLGHPNSTNTPTTITNTTDAALALGGYATGSGWGVKGTASSGVGVWGDSGSGTGVSGTGATGVHGVGSGDSSRGVYGESAATKSTGVHGKGVSTGVYGEGAYGVYGNGVSFGVIGNGSSIESYGVWGRGGHGGVLGSGRFGVAGSALVGAGDTGLSSGVYGSSAAGSASRGVTGESAAGRGVSGQATTGRGVHGQATSGRGVHGYASSGIGVYAAAGASGKAFHAEGRVSFKTAGLATVAAGSSSVVVTPGVDLTASSGILCTLMGNAGGSTTVKRVSVNTTANTFTIHLTAAAATSAKVAWFVIG